MDLAGKSLALLPIRIHPLYFVQIHEIVM
jgi:hypothetical protein